MAATYLISRPVNGNTDTDQRRTSAPATTTSTNHEHIKDTNPTCCSGDHVHGCGCGCRTCSCRYKPVKDESNRNAYSGQGGRQILRPINGVPATEMWAGSLTSNDSGHTDENESINNSYEVQDPFNDRLAADDVHQLNHTNLATAVIQNVATAFTQDEDDDNPWPRFVSPGDSPVSDGSLGLMFENMDGSSMIIEMDSPTSGDVSMLSSYESSFQRQSMTSSQVLTGAGTSFLNNNFLPLTPDWRHARNYQMCNRCMQY